MKVTNTNTINIECTGEQAFHLLQALNIAGEQGVGEKMTVEQKGAWLELQHSLSHVLMIACQLKRST